MILIADSGSTKTHWKLLHNDNTQETFYTTGLNPYFADEAVFSKVLSDDLPIPKTKVEKLFFYGSGCATDKKALFVKNKLKHFFPIAEIFVYGDLFGAARALLGHKKGIVCILGTGSVSCVYDGEKIIDNVPSLGFILADEGGGATLGKELLKAYFYKRLPEDLHKAFEETFQITREEVLEKVYHSLAPNAYMASFSSFLRANYSHPFIHDLVYRCFNDFFVNHIIVYPNYKELPLVFTGSVSSNLKEILFEVAAEHGISVSKIMKEPMEGLVEFHKS